MTYSKRGNTALQRKTDHITKSALRLLEKLIVCGTADDASKADVQAAFNAVIEIMPYIKPKLQAIAPASMDDDGNLISPQRYQMLLEIARQSQREANLVDSPEITLVLPEGSTDSPQRHETPPLGSTTFPTEPVSS